MDSHGVRKASRGLQHRRLAEGLERPAMLAGHQRPQERVAVGAGRVSPAVDADYVRRYLWIQPRTRPIASKSLTGLA